MDVCGLQGPEFPRWIRQPFAIAVDPGEAHHPPEHLNDQRAFALTKAEQGEGAGAVVVPALGETAGADQQIDAGSILMETGEQGWRQCIFCLLYTSRCV